MSRNRKRYREKRKQKKLEERLERVNEYGFSDYTPYNALTGSEIISKSTITDPQMKMPGGYNSTKK